MPHILVCLKEPERSAMAFDRLAGLDPSITVTQAGSMEELSGVDLSDVCVLITIGPHLGTSAGELYDRLPRLQWAQSIGTGTDHIKGHPALPPGAVVSNVHGLHGASLSEAAFAAMLGFSRDMRRQYQNQTQHLWEKYPARLLSEATVGILGIGAIASALAPRCKAFGMRVIGISGTARTEPGFDAIYARSDLKEAVRDLDYLVVLTPYSTQTHHILNADIFAAMKPEAYLINLSRGGVVDEPALLAALDGGVLAGAAIDAFETEPLPQSNPFWSHPKVRVTAHSAGFHRGYAQQAFDVIQQNVQKYLRGGVGALSNIV